MVRHSLMLATFLMRHAPTFSSNYIGFMQKQPCHISFKSARLSWNPFTHNHPCQISFKSARAWYVHFGKGLRLYKERVWKSFEIVCVFLRFFTQFWNHVWILFVIGAGSCLDRWSSFDFDKHKIAYCCQHNVMKRACIEARCQPALAGIYITDLVRVNMHQFQLTCDLWSASWKITLVPFVADNGSIAWKIVGHLSWF